MTNTMNSPMQVDVYTTLVEDADESLVPTYAHPDDAGADLRSRVNQVIAPGDIVPVPTGITVDIPSGYVGLIHPRSGLSLLGITVMNAPGTIDAGFEGEVKVILGNLGSTTFNISRGDRIAQMVLQEVFSAEFHLREVTTQKSARGSKGFGSTGIK